MYTNISNKYLKSIDKHIEKIEDEIKIYDKTQLKDIIKDNILYWEKEKRNKENSIVLSTGIIIPMFIMYATASDILDFLGVWRIIIFFTLLLIYIIYTAVTIYRKENIINIICALQKTLLKY